MMAAWNENKNWCRLVILLQVGGESVCKDILNEMGIEDINNGGEIYKRLQNYKTKIKRLAPYQQQILLPDSTDINTTKLDVSLQTHIIAILDKKKKYPLIKELREKRNKFFHMRGEERDMTEQQFKSYWDEISQLLRDLGIRSCDIGLLDHLQTDDQLSKDLENRLNDILLSIERFYLGLMEGIDQITDNTTKIDQKLTEGFGQVQELLEMILSEMRSVSLAEKVDVMSCPSEEDRSAFGRTKLTPKMKHFIASQMSDPDWKGICRRKLDDQSQEEIRRNNDNLYDYSYAVIRKLTEKQLVVYWSDMEEILKLVNKKIITKFTEKFQVSSKGNVIQEDDFELNSEMRRYITGKISKDWKKLARNLNIGDEVVDNIEEDRNVTCLEDKCQQVFLKLDATTNVTWNLVKEALRDIGREDIIAALTKKLSK